MESWDLEKPDNKVAKELLEKKIRITQIDNSGKVMYDSATKPENMDNHKDRLEVREALAKGEGEASRKSDIFGKRTFYYAMLDTKGEVLRVSKEAANLFSILCEMTWVVFLIGAGSFFLCLIMAQVLTKKIMEPIERMVGNLESEGSEVSYPELKPVMKRIREQRADIMKSANIRQEFTTNVSHELKTPLTAISGYAQLIENGMAKEKESRYFAGEIEKNSRRLLNLINDIIRLSELDGGEIPLVPEKINLKEVVLQCMEVLKVYAGQNGVTLSCRGVEAYVLAERTMLEELIYNLCDNGIRYNKENGMVEIAISYYFKKVVLTVEDNGIGIEEEHQERIFERFYRVDKSRSRNTGGTGLGLAIVKHIVSCCNAQLKLESKLGEGTKIEVIFPEI